MSIAVNVPSRLTSPGIGIYRYYNLSTGGCMMFQPVRCIPVIMTAFMLHNICVAMRLPPPVDDIDMIDPEDDNDEENDFARQVQDVRC